MTPEEIKEIRSKLGITQKELAALIGVHPMTGWKWEYKRNEMTPNAFQEAMIRRFGIAESKSPGAGVRASRLIVSEGVAAAIYHLLSAAYR